MFQKGVYYPKKNKKPKAPKARRTNPAEKAHMGEVAALGCICCSEVGIFREAQVHHLRHGTTTLNVGMSVRSDDFKTIPLCKMHHGPDGGGPGIAFHDGPREWRWDEVELLKREANDHGGKTNIVDARYIKPNAASIAVAAKRAAELRDAAPTDEGDDQEPPF